VQEFITTRQGYRTATSTGRVLTGRGADFILIDDPLKPDEAVSDVQRKATNEWYSNALYSRLNDKRSGAIVIIMQRLHEDDLVGHVLAQEPWELVCSPAIAEAERCTRSRRSGGPRCFTRRQSARHPRAHPPHDRRIQFRRSERARYEAQRAERRYRAVDAENRLVARGLESEWSSACARSSRPTPSSPGANVNDRSATTRFTASAY